MHLSCKISSAQVIPGAFPTNPKRIQQQEQRRVRATNRANKLQEVNEAKKRADKKKQVQQVQQERKAPFKLTHVYIGNLESQISPKRLEEHFAECGAIHSTVIRCSRGRAMTLGVAVPLAVRSPRDRQYASMSFYDTAAALKALKYHGSVLEGCELVVSASAADLPEVRDICRPTFQNMRRMDGLSHPPNRWLTKNRPLVRSDTLPDYSDPNNNKTRIGDYSFYMSVV